MFKKFKKYRFYVVKSRRAPNIFLTITNKKKDCDEYINKVLLSEHYNDFLKWCDTTKQTLGPNTWVDYYNSQLTEEEKTKYVIQKIYYKKDELTAILRMFCGCKAIGCSFDIKEETQYVQGHQLIQKALEDKFKEYLDKLSDGDSGLELPSEDDEEYIQ